jgi:hypothetical protein
MCNIALAGGTAPEVMAISGHKDMRVVQEYLDKVFKRPELADAAITKLRTKRDGNLQTQQSPITNIGLSP